MQNNIIISENDDKLRFEFSQPRCVSLSTPKGNKKLPQMTEIFKSVNQFNNLTTLSAYDNPYGGDLPRKVWLYWAQGLENAPSIVKRSIYSVQKRNQDREVIILDDNSIHKYIEMPSYLSERKAINKTHFSDILRVGLLKKHGGTWCDATALMKDSVSNLQNLVFQGDNPETFQRSKFFCFTSGDFISSWFLISSQNNIVPSIIYDYLLWYWKDNDILPDYFFFHYAFQAFYFQRPDFAAVWDRTYRLSSKKAHLMQAALSQPYDAAKFKTLLNESPVHKLTYKDRPNNVEGMLWGHLEDMKYAF